jgi:hypothetical protein
LPTTNAQYSQSKQEGAKFFCVDFPAVRIRPQDKKLDFHETSAKMIFFDFEAKEGMFHAKLAFSAVARQTETEIAGPIWILSGNLPESATVDSTQIRTNLFGSLWHHECIQCANSGSFHWL